MSLTTLMTRLARPALPLLVAALAAGSVSAQTAAPAASAEATAIRKTMQEKFPGAEIKGITKTGYLGGLYEVQFDDRIVYTDPKVSHVLVGAMFDAGTKQNLTEERLRKLNRVSWDNLPLELAIKKVKGKGERKLVVFSDADCPYCHKLEQEMAGLDNVTIYTFLFPIDQLHPEAAQKSKQIWCSPDRTKAWDEFFVSGNGSRQQGRLQQSGRGDAGAGPEAAHPGDADDDPRRRLDPARRGAARAPRVGDEGSRGRREEAGGREEVTASRARKNPARRRRVSDRE